MLQTAKNQLKRLGEPWTYDELQFLIKHIGALGVSDMAKTLERTEEAIKSKYRKEMR